MKKNIIYILLFILLSINLKTINATPALPDILSIYFFDNGEVYNDFDDLNVDLLIMEDEFPYNTQLSIESLTYRNEFPNYDSFTFTNIDDEWYSYRAFYPDAEYGIVRDEFIIIAFAHVKQFEEFKIVFYNDDGSSVFITDVYQGDTFYSSEENPEYRLIQYDISTNEIELVIDELGDYGTAYNNVLGFLFGSIFVVIGIFYGTIALGVFVVIKIKARQKRKNEIT